MDHIIITAFNLLILLLSRRINNIYIYRGMTNSNVHEHLDSHWFWNINKLKPRNIYEIIIYLFIFNESSPSTSVNKSTDLENQNFKKTNKILINGHNWRPHFDFDGVLYEFSKTIWLSLQFRNCQIIGDA